MGLCPYLGGGPHCGHVVTGERCCWCGARSDDTPPPAPLPQWYGNAVKPETPNVHSV